MSRALRRMREARNAPTDEERIEEEDMAPAVPLVTVNPFGFRSPSPSPDPSEEEDESEEVEETAEKPKTNKRRRGRRNKRAAAAAAAKFLQDDSSGNEDAENTDESDNMDDLRKLEDSEYEEDSIMESENRNMEPVPGPSNAELDFEASTSQQEVPKLPPAVEVTVETYIDLKSVGETCGVYCLFLDGTIYKRPINTIENRILDPIHEIRKEKAPIQIKSNNPRFFNSRLTTPSPDWPYSQKAVGIAMKQVSKTHVYTFAFEHNNAYSSIQERFINYMRTSKTDDILALAMEFPFHVDSLLQSAKIWRRRRDMEREIDMVARALYCLEAALHPSFSFSRGDCELPFDMETNRSFHLALLLRAGLADAKGAPRSALELCKLSVNLDPTDPLAVVLLMDKLALEAGEYEWMMGFYKRFEDQRFLSMLPNWVFSMVVASYKLLRRGVCCSHKPVLFLETAVRTYPWVLRRLVEDGDYQMCAAVRNAPFMQESGESKPSSLKLLINTYYMRCALFWKDPEFREWVNMITKLILTDPDLSRERIDRIVNCYGDDTPIPILRHMELARDLPISTEGPESLPYWDPFHVRGGALTRLPPVVEPENLPTRQSIAMTFLRSMDPSFIP